MRMKNRLEFDEVELFLDPKGKLEAVSMHQEMTLWIWSLFSAINQFSSKHVSNQHSFNSSNSRVNWVNDNAGNMQKVLWDCTNMEEYLCDIHTLQPAMRDTFVQVYGMKRILKIHFLKQSSSWTTQWPLIIVPIGMMPIDQGQSLIAYEIGPEEDLGSNHPWFCKDDFITLVLRLGTGSAVADCLPSLYLLQLFWGDKSHRLEILAK